MFLFADSDSNNQTGRVPRPESSLGAKAILLVLSHGSFAI